MGCLRAFAGYDLHLCYPKPNRPSCREIRTVAERLTPALTPFPLRLAQPHTWANGAVLIDKYYAGTSGAQLPTGPRAGSKAIGVPQTQRRRFALAASASLTRRRIASEREGLSGS